MAIQDLRTKIRCVIYDCDGVLFDSLESNIRLYNDLCRSVSRPPLTEEEIRYVQSHTVFEAIHFLFGHAGDLEKRAFGELKNIDFRHYIDHLKMEPDLMETLSLLKERDILRAISTNRTTTMRYIMEKFNLGPYFEMVVTALDVKNPKPHPESVKKILDAFNLKKEEVIFVGDSEVDQQTAKASGIRFIAFRNLDVAQDLFIENHLDLLKLLQI